MIKSIDKVETMKNSKKILRVTPKYTTIHGITKECVALGSNNS